MNTLSWLSPFLNVYNHLLKLNRVLEKHDSPSIYFYLSRFAVWACCWPSSYLQQYHSDDKDGQDEHRAEVDPQVVVEQS